MPINFLLVDQLSSQDWLGHLRCCLVYRDTPKRKNYLGASTAHAPRIARRLGFSWLILAHLGLSWLILASRRCAVIFSAEGLARLFRTQTTAVVHSQLQRPPTQRMHFFGGLSQYQVVSVWVNFPCPERRMLPGTGRYARRTHRYMMRLGSPSSTSETTTNGPLQHHACSRIESQISAYGVPKGRLRPCSRPGFPSMVAFSRIPLTRRLPSASTVWRRTKPRMSRQTPRSFRHRRNMTFLASKTGTFASTKCTSPSLLALRRRKTDCQVSV